jgi:hypothetical protein
MYQASMEYLGIHSSPHKGELLYLRSVQSDNHRRIKESDIKGKKIQMWLMWLNITFYSERKR